MISLFSRKKHAREDGEVTRRHILETAVRLFAEHGYADTTSKMICREAGVNIAAVNYHFNSRDDLYRAVLEPHNTLVKNEKTEQDASKTRKARITRGRVHRRT